MYDPHSPLKLPQLSPEAVGQSATLTSMLREEIEESGSISFNRFMAMSLYAPGLGYYASGQAMIGPQGDFITAPEISPLFGRCVARQCAEVLNNLGGGDIFEVGAGSGILASQVMQELDAIGSLPDHYYIFDISPAMRKRQEARLQRDCADFYDRFHWIPQPLSEHYQGVIIANEVVDCLPMRRFRCQGERIMELRVKNKERGFAWEREWADRMFEERVYALVNNLPHELPDGYQSEINTDMARWLHAVSYGLKRGLLLVIDYGYSRHEYYHPERSDGTLLCHYRHRVHDDPFIFVGLQDITSFVDFTTFAELADELPGMAVAGYTTQAAFLLDLGIEQMLNDDQSGQRAHAKLRAGVQRLLNPNDMGERFKVIGCAKNYTAFGTPAGFLPLDMREKLDPVV